MIKFREVTKKYEDGTVAVEKLSLDIEDGDFVAIIGKSGSGKTTTMRMINRMTELSSGKILIDDENIMDIDPVSLRRKIGYVIQQTGLMPHMTVYENIIMVPKLLKWPKEELEKTALDLIKLADMPEDYLERYPSELSGGQQQRIGVLRALAANQKIILMDEPFGALDPMTRITLQKLIKDIQKKYGTTVVFVTHDMDEALDLADKIAIMNKGKLVQYDSPNNILRNPANEFVEEFLGEERLIGSTEERKTIGEIMYTSPIYTHEYVSTKDAIAIMKENKTEILFIADEDSILKGYIDIELIKKYGKRYQKIGEFMDKDIISLKEDDEIQNCARKILKSDIRDIPVVDKEGKLIGLLQKCSLVDMIYDYIWDSEISEGLVIESKLVEDINKKIDEHMNDSGLVVKAEEQKGVH